ncbi:MAG: NOB1 family endonuclease [Halococcoides sp.]
MYVLDASAFIEGVDPDGPTASIPAVREELTDSSRYRYEALEGAGMRVHVPDSATLDRVHQVARETGDRDALSETDRRVLAAALELDAVVVTDDYAIQNVAEALDLGVESVARDDIDEQREWIYQCQGCGREFEDDHDRCPICGTELERKNPSNG